MDYQKYNMQAVVANLVISIAIVGLILIFIDVPPINEQSDSIGIAILIFVYVSIFLGALASGVISKMDRYSVFVPILVFTLLFATQIEVNTSNPLGSGLFITAIIQIIIILTVVQSLGIVTANFARQKLIGPFEEVSEIN